jgi:hypothetical protein
MNEYMMKSPILIFHYQRSHMKFLDSLYKEYVEKKDYSVFVRQRKSRRGQQQHKN